MRTMKYALSALILVGSVGTLTACASNGYERGYSSVSVGVTSSDGYRTYRDRDGDGVPNRYDRDRDGDGVPNRFDDRPGNPFRD
jgi:hypothetical protein